MLMMRVSQEQLSAEQKETALIRTPSLLEICGHSYFFGGFLVGPQVRIFRHFYISVQIFHRQMVSHPICAVSGKLSYDWDITHDLGIHLNSELWCKDSIWQEMIAIRCSSLFLAV